MRHIWYSVSHKVNSSPQLFLLVLYDCIKFVVDHNAYDIIITLICFLDLEYFGGKSIIADL